MIKEVNSFLGLLIVQALVLAAAAGSIGLALKAVKYAIKAAQG